MFQIVASFIVTVSIKDDDNVPVGGKERSKKGVSLLLGKREWLVGFLTRLQGREGQEWSGLGNEEKVIPATRKIKAGKPQIEGLPPKALF